MLVGVDSIVSQLYLNKLTWPRAETKKSLFLQKLTAQQKINTAIRN